MTNDDYPKIYGAPSVDHDPTNYDTVLKWFVLGDTVVEVRIPVEDAASALRDLSRNLTYAMEDAARNIAQGDCDYCKNIRLVEAPGPGNRTQQVYCPECNPTGHNTPFANAPIVGPKVKGGFGRG